MEIEDPNISDEVEEFESQHFDKEYAKDIFKKFSEDSAYTFIYTLNYDWISSKKIEDADLKELISSELVNTSTDLNITLNFLTKNELIKICDDLNITYKSSNSKAKIISLILENLDPENEEDLIQSVPIALKRDKRVEEVFGSIKHFYHKLYPRENLILFD